MYATGQFNNFESRLHQMPLSASDMASFITEGDYYLASMTIYIHMSGKWEREAQRKMWKIYNDATYLSRQIFGTGSVITSSGHLLNEDGSFFLLEDGAKILYD